MNPNTETESVDDQSTGDLTKREAFAQIKSLCTANDYSNAIVLARQYALFFAVVAGSIWCMKWIESNGYSLGWYAPVYIATVLFVGIWFQNRLACLVHESSHYTLFKGRKKNDILANLFVAFPFFGLISNYRIGHWGHHRYVNEPDKDPDLLRLAQHHPRNFPVSKLRFLWEYVILQLSPHKAYTYLKGRISYVSVTMEHKPVANQDPLGKPLTWALRIGYYGALATALTLLGGWTYYAMFWLIPLIVAYPATLFLRELGHHGNYPDNGDYTNSRVYEGYFLEREIFFPYSEQNHVIHHLFPTIPWHNMRQAHDVMMRYQPYRENVVICDGFFLKKEPASGNPSVLDVLTNPADHYLSTKAADLSLDVRNEMNHEVGGSNNESHEKVAAES